MVCYGQESFSIAMHYSGIKIVMAFRTFFSIITWLCNSYRKNTAFNLGHSNFQRIFTMNVSILKPNYSKRIHLVRINGLWKSRWREVCQLFLNQILVNIDKFLTRTHQYVGLTISNLLVKILRFVCKFLLNNVTQTVLQTVLDLA